MKYPSLNPLQKVLIGIGILILVCVVLYSSIIRWKIKNDPNADRPVFHSKTLCELSSGMVCSYIECKFDAKEGKTNDEVCGKNFSPGWVPL